MDASLCLLELIVVRVLLLIWIGVLYLWDKKVLKYYLRYSLWKLNVLRKYNSPHTSIGTHPLATPCTRKDDNLQMKISLDLSINWKKLQQKQCKNARYLIINSYGKITTKSYSISHFYNTTKATFLKIKIKIKKYSRNNKNLVCLQNLVGPFGCMSL